jgi:F-type H+-transporting ATPase subunit b
MIDINGTLVVQVINIIIFFLVVKRFLLQPLLKVMDERRSMIQGSLDEADGLIEESKTLKAAYQEKVGYFESEGSRILEQFRREGEGLKDEIVDNGRREARLLVESAGEEVSAMKQEAIKEVREASVDLAMDMSEKILREFLNEDRQRLISEKVLDKVKSRYEEK